MPGLRVHHPSLRSCTLIVPHPGNNEGRAPKDYYVHLDAEGAAYVSDRVWTRLVEAKDSGLSPHELLVLNEVADPPDISMGDVPAPEVRTYRQGQKVTDAQLLTVAQQFAPRGVRARITTKE